MSDNAWSESAASDVLFPDDLPGRGPVTVVGEPLEATEVETDTVQYGLVAELAEGHAAEYLAAPQALRAEIGDRWDPEAEAATVEVAEAHRGPADHDPWEFDFRDPDAPADE